MLKRFLLHSSLVWIGFFCTVHSTPGFASSCRELFQKNTLPALSSQSITLDGFLKFQQTLSNQDPSHLDYRGTDYLVRLYLSEFDSQKSRPLLNLIAALDKEGTGYNPFFNLLTKSFLSQFNLDFLSTEEALEMFQYALSESTPQKIAEMYLEEIEVLLTTLENLSGTRNIMQLKYFLTSKGIDLSDLSEFKKIMKPLTSEELPILALWLAEHHSIQTFQDIFSSTQEGTSLIKSLGNTISEQRIQFRDEHGRILAPKREVLKQLILKKSRSATAIESEFFQRYSEELLALLEENSITTEEFFGKEDGVLGEPNSKIFIAHSHKTGENLFIIKLRASSKILFFAPRNDTRIKSWRRRRRYNLKVLATLGRRFLKYNLTENSFFGSLTSGDSYNYNKYDVFPWDFTALYGNIFDLSDGSVMYLAHSRSDVPHYFRTEINIRPYPEERALVPLSLPPPSR